ncbi:MAG TPA: hypothetical protein VGX48_13465 [Pyrinomonadaceae bacterium]|jgi:hypothetical protein|nr:hypothetical protein [Pyrinomonadaceae bacterium]
MSTLLFTVVDTFLIEKRGLVLAADVKSDRVSLRVGESIELRRPDGSIVVSKVAGIAHLSPYDPERTLDILLPPDISKEDVPVGTQVWSRG